MDAIKIKKLAVHVQENGIIREDTTGRFLGRLDGISFEELEDKITPITIKTTCVILNGEPSKDTLMGYVDKGYEIIHKDKAKMYHPYATDTDIILFLAKPIDKEAYDTYISRTRKLDTPTASN